MAYLGYMRLDKGFAMMLSALKAASRALQQQLRLVVAAKRSDERSLRHSPGGRPAARRLRFYDGYTHDDLPIILESVDVGLVPVQWGGQPPPGGDRDDGARGPAAHLRPWRGAQELGGRNPEFVFEATKPSALKNVSPHWPRARPR